jgi:opacity protein-like surface antigen
MRFSRLVSIAALAAAPALAPSSLFAQTTTTGRPVSFGVSAGASVPVGDLGNSLKTGYNVTGHVWLTPPSLQAVGFRGDVGYDSWKFKSLSNVTNVDGSFRSLSVTGNALLKINSSSGLHPYIIGGGGLYNTKSSVGSVSSNSQSNFGVQGGAGVEFALSGFATFVEAKFVNVFSGNSGSSSGNSARYVPITFGVRF